MFLQSEIDCVYNTTGVSLCSVFVLLIYSYVL